MGGSGSAHEPCRLPRENVLVTGVSLPESITVCLDDERYVYPTVFPENALDQRMFWSVSDPDVVGISENTYNTLTYVKGISAGSAILTAESSDGAFTAQCIVTVLPYKRRDVNGDGKISIRDAAMMMRAQAGWDQEGYHPEVQDFSDDGRFNAKDIVMLIRSII